jgi:tetratricopeptide (TPR) repeat protein
METASYPTILPSHGRRKTRREKRVTCPGSDLARGNRQGNSHVGAVADRGDYNAVGGSASLSRLSSFPAASSWSVGTTYRLGRALVLQGRQEESQAVWLDAFSLVQRARREGRKIWAGGAGDALVYPDLLSVTRRDDASLREALRENNRAESEVEKEMRQDPNSIARSWWHMIFADIYDRLGSKPDAVRHARLALDAIMPEDIGRRHLCEYQSTRLLCDAGKTSDAEQLLRQALTNCQRQSDNDHVLASYARVDLAEFLNERKKFDEADSLLQQAQKGLLAEPRVPVSERKRVCGALAKLYETTGRADQAAAWWAKRDAILPAAASAPAAATPARVEKAAVPESAGKPAIKPSEASKDPADKLAGTSKSPAGK